MLCVMSAGSALALVWRYRVDRCVTAWLSAEEVLPPFLAANERSLSMFSLTSTNAAPLLGGLVRWVWSELWHQAVRIGICRISWALPASGNAVSVTSGEAGLRGGRELVQSVRDGRWSNPTWNIAREPDAGDSEITHTVHVGFRRNALDGTTLLGQVRERAQ